MKPSSFSSPDRISGFTLMEVLVAMAIGLVVLVGALSYFGRGIKALQTGDSYARLHENASRAAAILSRDIQLAGFYGYGGSATETGILPAAGFEYGSRKFTPAFAENYTNSPNKSFPTDCGASNLTDLYSPLEHYDSPSSAERFKNYPEATCFPNALTSSPILIVRGALEGVSRSDITSADFVDADFPTNQLLVAASPNVGTPAVLLFFGNGNPVVDNGDGLKRAIESGLLQDRRNGRYMPVFPYTFRAYYLRSCNLMQDTTHCEANDIEPTLVRQQLVALSPHVGSGGVESPSLVVNRLTPGVQHLQFYWGIDNRGEINPQTGQNIGDGVTDYWTTDIATPSIFNNVNTVRIQMLVRANVPDPAYNDSENNYFFDTYAGGADQQYNCNAGGNLGWQGAPNECNFRRLLYESATSVRNCSLRRRSGLNQGAC